MTDVPNFSGTYPGSGDRIGPAWRAAWIMLADGLERSVAELHVPMTRAAEAASGDGEGIALKTTGNLLRQAAKRGLLERNYKLINGSITGFYRRKVDQ